MTSNHDPSDRSRELARALALVALGDRAAFADVYRLTRGHLFGVILRINTDRGQAEDVLQEVYVNVWRAAGGYDPSRSQAMTWLTTIARHRAIDSLRRGQHDPIAAAVAPAVADDGSDDDRDRLPSDLPGPLELLQRATDARQLSRCVGELSAEQRQSLALAYYDGLSHSEVAARLVQPLGTVKSWLRRALLSLKDCLDRATGAGA